VNPRIAGIGTALPAHRFAQDRLYAEALEPYFRDNPKAGKIFAHPGIAYRHSVLPDPAAFFAGRPGAGARNAVYAAEAPGLARQAVEAALASAGFEAAALGTLVTTTCTGYMTPGIDLKLAATLGMAPGLRRYALGGMGCYAAFPGLNAALASLRSGEAERAVVSCTELCTLHFQVGSDTDNVVTTSLFADGASAIALDAAPGPGWQVEATRTATLYDTAEHMTWHLTDTGFQMYLSAYVPMILRDAVGSWLTGWLAERGLAVGDVQHWGIHPGGPRILDGLQAAFGLADAQLAPSRTVLRECGNMSSATVFFILDALTAAGPRPGERAVLLAFGPGLTMEGALLRWEA